MKVLIEHYMAYGKNDSEILIDEYVVEDSRQAREDILNELYYDDCFGEENFVNGKINRVFYEKQGNDWHKPISGYFQVYTYESKLEVLQKQFDSDLAYLKSQFGIEE